VHNHASGRAFGRLCSYSAALLAAAMMLSGCAAIAGRALFQARGPSALDLVLQRLHLTLQDLALGKTLRERPDPFLLSRVRSMRAAPLSMAALARDIDAGFRHQPCTLGALLRRGAQLLDADVQQAAAPEDGPGPALGLPPAVEEILAALQAAENVLGEAFAELDQEEAGFVKRMFEKVLYRGEWSEELSRSDSQLRLELAFRLAARIDLQKMALAGALVADALDSAMPALTAEPQAMPEGRRLQSALGDVVIGTRAADLYEGEAPLLLIDPGGDDLYRLDAREGLHVLVDLGGNDTYEAEDSAAPSAGIFGLGFLVDLDGHDLYRGAQFAWGCGLLGIGVLADLNGNDRYVCRSFGQGAAALGLGLLYDRSGDDIYQSDLYSQGLGYVGGVGMLVDASGHDRYESGACLPDAREKDGAFQTYSQGFGLGCRQFASGGIGLLYDGAGNDAYAGSYFCQGSSYWQSLGLLIDAQGDDRYEARRYAQGAGIHSSLGGLFDYRGHDRYASWGVSQGCGHDYGIGLLYDAQGADQYVAAWFSQGAGGSIGLGLLIDEAGDDSYLAAGPNVQGCGEHDARRDAASIGLLVDSGGRDMFAPAARAQQVWAQGDVGGGTDIAGGRSGVEPGPARPVAAGRFPRQAQADAPAPSLPCQGEVLPELEAQLFLEDSWHEAAAALARRGPEVITLLCAYLAIKDVSVRRTIEEALKLLAVNHVEAVHAAVYRQAADEETSAFLLYVLGDVGSPSSRALFYEQLHSPLARVQAMALRGLYKLQALPPPDMVSGLAASPSAGVRRYLCLALGAADDQGSLHAMCSLLADRDFQVRRAAFTAIKARGHEARPLLAELRQRMAGDALVQEMVRELLQAGE